jgi:hypothetical protein
MATNSTNLVLSDVIIPATQAQWLTTLIGAATTLGLPATSWQSGGIARTILAIASYGFSFEDAMITAATQGGFLDFAATGTVSFTNPITGAVTTSPVTPDPSIPAQWPSANTPPLPGWLDILADGSYNVQRIQPTYASGTLAITNTSASAYGTYAAGTFHVANPTTGATYSNVNALTIGASAINAGVSGASNTGPITITTVTTHSVPTGATVTISGVLGNTAANGTWVVGAVTSVTMILLGSTGNGAYISGGTVNVCYTGTFQADVAGLSGQSLSPNTITQPVTSLLGVSVTNTGAFAATGYESNTALAARCRLKLQSLSTGGPPGAYKYWALSSSSVLAALLATTASGSTVGLSTAVTRALVSYAAGVVTTTVANTSGAMTGVSNLAITGAANNGSGLIRLTVSSTTGITTSMIANVSGVVGSVPANGFWTLTLVDGTHVDLQGSAFSGAYTSGGVLEAGDLGLVDYVLQQNAVPLGTTALTQTAGSTAVAISATVYVPAAYATAYAAAANTAITAYFGSLPIGGLATDGATNIVPIGAVEGVLYAAGILSGATTSYVYGITGLTLNGGTADVTVGATNVATPALTLSVQGQ